jgi:hypothetical protein
VGRALKLPECAAGGTVCDEAVREPVMGGRGNGEGMELDPKAVV